MHFTGTKTSTQIPVLLKPKLFSSHGGFLTNAVYYHREGWKLEILGQFRNLDL